MIYKKYVQIHKSLKSLPVIFLLNKLRGNWSVVGTNSELTSDYNWSNIEIPVSIMHCANFQYSRQETFHLINKSSGNFFYVKQRTIQSNLFNKALKIFVLIHRKENILRLFFFFLSTGSKQFHEFIWEWRSLWHQAAWKLWYEIKFWWSGRFQTIWRQKKGKIPQSSYF